MWVCQLASFISFIPCPFFTLPSFSLSTTPRERSPPIHTSNSFHPISPHLSSKPQTKQPYASPSSSSTLTLKKPFNIGASSFPPVFPLTFFHHSKTDCLYSSTPPPPPQTRQNVRTDANAQEVAKDNWNPVLIIEPEFQHITNPLSLARSLHPPGWEHPKVETLKTQRFYEFILVDTNSIAITH